MTDNSNRRRGQWWGVIALFAVAGGLGGFSLGQITTRDRAASEVDSIKAAYNESRAANQAADDARTQALEMCLRLAPKAAISADSAAKAAQAAAEAAAKAAKNDPQAVPK